MEIPKHVVEDADLVSVYFSSVIELLDYIESPVQHRNTEVMRDYLRRKSPSWYGPTNSSAMDAINHALTGDSELCEKYLEPMAHKLETDVKLPDYSQTIQKSVRRTTHGPMGDEIDIHKVYSGDLNRAWRSTKRVPVDMECPLVTLFVDICVNGNINAESTLWTAAVTYYLVKQLEASGKSVRVVSGDVSAGAFNDSRKNLVAAIVIKEYGQNLAIERLAAMTHAGFLRSFGFASICAHNLYNVSASLGSAVRLGPKYTPIQIRKEVEEGLTKMVFVDSALSLGAARSSLHRAIQQMEKHRGGEIV